MSYPDSVRYLYALGNELKAGAKFGLERMQLLMRELGNPELRQSFVHVAGTNGKGSTSAMIASALRASGKRIGLFTSPHLIEPTERIQVNGLPVSAEAFSALFEVVHRAAERLVQRGIIDAHPTYFETVTAMAFVHFAATCDVSVIEVGLGGRLDATNVLIPELTVITPVSFDHEAFLGNTIDLIAREKAGILKPQIPLVLAPQQVEAEPVILGHAYDLGCPVSRVADSVIDRVAARPTGADFFLDSVPFRCPLPGRHQVVNAATAVLACRELRLDDASIKSGLINTSWPGRLEYVSRNPDFVLDGAHNPAGAEALANYIEEFCWERPVWIVYGAMRDKAIEEVMSRLFPLARHLILTAPDFPRALRPEALAEIADHPHRTIAATSAEAIKLAEGAPGNAIVFFTGSLYLVGEVRRSLLATLNKR